MRTHTVQCQRADGQMYNITASAETAAEAFRWGESQGHRVLGVASPMMKGTPRKGGDAPSSAPLVLAICGIAFVPAAWVGIAMSIGKTDPLARAAVVVGLIVTAVWAVGAVMLLR